MVAGLSWMSWQKEAAALLYTQHISAKLDNLKSLVKYKFSLTIRTAAAMAIIEMHQDNAEVMRWLILNEAVPVSADELPACCTISALVVRLRSWSGYPLLITRVLN